MVPCRYEGEFAAGFAHGLGVYTAADGQVYRGEFMYGRKHGYVQTCNAADALPAISSA